MLAVDYFLHQFFFDNRLQTVTLLQEKATRLSLLLLLPAPPKGLDQGHRQ